VDYLRTEAVCNIPEIIGSPYSLQMCGGKKRTVNKMIHFRLFYDSEQERATLRWWSDVLTTVYYKGPFNGDPKMPVADEFLDYSIEPDQDKRDEDLPSGVSFAEDVTNYLAAFDGSCQNDSLVMIWIGANSTLKPNLSHKSQFLTSIRFPSGNLKLKEDRNNSWVWRNDQAPSVAYKEDRHEWTTVRPGWRYLNYNWYEAQWSIYGADTVLSFFTYLTSRTYWDWDTSIWDTGRVVDRHTRDQWPRLAHRLFQLNDHPAEQALIKIVDTFWAHISNIINQYYEYQYYYHFDIIKLWIKQVNLPYKAKIFGNSNSETKMVGLEYQNLVEPLKESCIIKELSVCFCTNGNKTGNPITATVGQLDTRNFNTVTDFNRFKTIAAYNDLYKINSLGACGSCFSSNKHVQYFVGDTTWFLYLQPTLHKYVTDINLNGLPTELRLRDAFSSSTFANFDLGYVSFISFTNQGWRGELHGLTHVVSFQYLWGKWFYYDPIEAVLSQVTNNDPTQQIKDLKLVFSAAVYFRR